MENNIFITNREIVYLDTYSLEKELNRRMNIQCNKDLEEWLDRKEEVNKKLRSDLLMYQHQYWCLTD